MVGFDHDLLGPRRDEIGDPRAIAVTCYSLADPSFSPPGTTHLVIMDLQYSEPWTRLSPADYLDAKFAYGGKLIDFAQRSIPGLRDTLAGAWTGTGGFEPTLTAGAAAAEAVLDAIGRNGRGSTRATR